MTLTALGPDSLITVDGHFAVRVALPWIRSMPLWCVGNLVVTIDEASALASIRLAGREVAPAALTEEQAWWFLQDRLMCITERPADGGEHTVGVSFDLLVPYLQATGDTPLTLSFSARCRFQTVSAENSFVLATTQTEGDTP